MQFQAPYDIVGMRNQQMKEDALKQEQTLAQQEQIFSALGQLAGVFQEQETMKASVKSGEQMLKMFGGQLGIDSKILSSPEYKSMGMRGQAALHGNLWGSLGAISNMRMANARFGLQQQAPYVEAGLKNQQNIAGGNVPHGSMGVPRPPKGISNVEPDLPVDDEDLPAVTTPAAVAPMPIPGGDESMRKYNEWKSKRGK